MSTASTGEVVTKVVAIGNSIDKSSGFTAVDTDQMLTSMFAKFSRNYKEAKVAYDSLTNAVLRYYDDHTVVSATRADVRLLDKSAPPIKCVVADCASHGNEKDPFLQPHIALFGGNGVTIDPRCLADEKLVESRVFNFRYYLCTAHGKSLQESAAKLDKFASVVELCADPIAASATASSESTCAAVTPALV